MIKRIFVLLFNPLSLPIIWVAFLFTFLAGAARYFYLLKSGGGDRVIRLILSGLWRSSIILAVFFLITIALWIWRYLKVGLARKNKISFVIVGISTILTLYISQSLLQLEKSNYNNYLYTTFGLTQSSVELVRNLSLPVFMLLIGFILYERKRFARSNILYSSRKIITLFFLAILVWYSALSFVNIGDGLGYLQLSYDKEFEGFRHIVELNKVVPQNGKVILPVQGWVWPSVGNPPIVRYFLYPRVLISSLYITGQDKADNLGDAYFIALKNDKDGAIWPVIDEKNNKIMFKEGTSLSYYKLLIFSKRDSMVVYRIFFNK